METTKELLQISARLYQHLQEVPVAEKRDQYVEEVEALLEQRGKLIELMRPSFKLDKANKTHNMLVDLDKGIQERLQRVMYMIKSDLKALQVTKYKKNKYMNPYSNVAIMDGRYYDKKN